MTYRSALEEGKKYLENRGVPEPETDAWYLLEHVCGFNRTGYLLHMNREMEETEYARYQSVLMERGKRIPLQHITGEQEFMGLTFRVNDQVLIPRQDTEILVETAMKQAKPGMQVLDLCTGSGCIIISLMKLRPGIEGTASDISADALKVARENADRLDVKVRFVESDLFERIYGRFDLIVSNPPYIPTGAIGRLMEEVRLHDPRRALDGHGDGLYFYRKIIAESDLYLKQGGWLMFEIGSDQGEAVTAMMRRAGYTRVEVIRDLAGLDRVVTGRRS